MMQNLISDDQKRSVKTVLMLLSVMITAGIMLWSCAPGTIIPGRDRHLSPAEALFAQAEESMRKGAYHGALLLYERYLNEFPQAGQIPEALLKMGTILSEQGEFDKARLLYSRLLTNYSETTFAEDARIQSLATWYYVKDYQEVIRRADQLDDRLFSDVGLARKYSLVGDTYLALGQTVDAAYVFIAALRQVGPEAQNRLLIKLDQVTRKIEPGNLQALLSAITEAEYRGYLTCQLGQKYIQSGDYDRAVSVLSDYLTACPGSDYSRRAKELIVTIDKQATYDPYTIGCLLPLSGKYKVFGEKAWQGVQLAFQEFSKGRGDNQPEIKLVIQDSESDPGQAVQAVKTLVAKRVATIIGPLGPFEEAVKEAQAHHVPIIAMTQKQDLTQAGEYVFRNFLTPQMQIKELVSYVCGDLGLSRLAVLYPEEEYGRVFAHLFWDEVLGHGGTIVAFESYDPQETDFAEPVKKLVGLYYPVPPELEEIREERLLKLGLLEEVEETEAGAEEGLLEVEVEEEEEDMALVDFEAIFVPDGSSNAGLIVPQLIYHDIVDTLFLGTNLWHNQDLIKVAKVYAHGSVLPTGFWEESQAENVRSFSDNFSSVFGKKPDFITAVAYDTAKIMFQIVEGADRSYRSSLKDKLVQLRDFPGVTGLTSFGAGGEAQKRVPLLKIKGRRFVEVPILPANKQPSSSKTDKGQSPRRGW